MTHIDEQKVQLHQAQGWDFKFGDYLQQAFEIYQKEWINYSLFALLSLIIYTVAGFTIIGIFFLALPLALGYATATEKVLRNETLALGDFFAPFSKMMNLFLLAIIIIGISLLIYSPVLLTIIPAILSNSMEPSSASEALGILTGGAMMIVIPIVALVLLAFILLVIFAPYFVYYGNYSAVEAIKQSIKLAKKNALMIFLFIIVCSILGQIGAVVCYVGLLFTLPIASIAQFLMVKDAMLKENQTSKQTTHYQGDYTHLDS